MMELMWIALCIFIGAPMIFFPEKVLERPACKIKSKTMVRVCGVIVIIAGFLSPISRILL